MKERRDIVLWYLRRPRLYPHLAYLAANYLLAGDGATEEARDEAGAWCAERAIDTNEALKRLTGTAPPAPVRELFPGFFEIADVAARRCPVEMGGAADVDLIYWSAEYLGAERAIETGVAYGWSSLAFLLSLRERKGARLISTDIPYPNRDNEPYVGCVVPDEMSPYWRIVRAPDRQAVPRALRALGTIDMCHYDSDKSYRGRMWTYQRLWKALRPGGFFISDDIGDNGAFRAFSETVARTPVVVGRNGKYVGVLTKA